MLLSAVQRKVMDEYASEAVHQIALTNDSREKTTFALGSRMYYYNRMTMGFKG